MVLGVLVVELQGVVVDVRDRRHRYTVDAEPLELQAGHGAGRVLEEDLVDAQLDLLLGAAGEVLVDDLLGERARHHGSVPTSVKVQQLTIARSVRAIMAGASSRRAKSASAARPTPAAKIKSIAAS